jgi:hypothetical protein
MNPRRRPQGSESHAVPSGGNHNDGRFGESLSPWHDGVWYLKIVLPVTLAQRMYYIVLQLSMQKLVETRQGPFVLWVLCRNPTGTAILAGVGFPAKTATVAVVAVGMWKPAFGAGFQAPWDERQLCVTIPPEVPRSVVSTANRAILPISCKCRRRTILKTKILVFRKPRNMHILPDSCSEPFCATIITHERLCHRG